MPESEVVRIARLQREKLLAREANEMRLMARRWLEVERALEAEMLKVVAELAKESIVTEAMILKNARMQSLLYQARNQFAKYADFMEEKVTKIQKVNLAFGANDAFKILKAGADEVGLGMTFDQLNVKAIEYMFGFGADGSPLKSLLMKSYGDAVNGILRELAGGLAKGLNPIRVAKGMAEGFGIGLDRALVIARTETLRAYRMGSQEQYKDSGVVMQYKRMATISDRTCVGCLMQDGKIYDTVDEFEEHPNGRCTLIPIVNGGPVPTWETGKEWFERQSLDKQAEILGPGRFEAWQNGTALEDMSKHVEDATWGGSWVPTPVGEL